MVCIQNLVLSPARGAQVVRESTIRWMSQEVQRPLDGAITLCWGDDSVNNMLAHKHGDVSLISRTHMKTKT